MTEHARAQRRDGTRPWCNAAHICHHWFEDECSTMCDRGHHDHAIGDPRCTDADVAHLELDDDDMHGLADLGKRMLISVALAAGLLIVGAIAWIAATLA